MALQAKHMVEAVTQRVSGKDATGNTTITEAVELSPVIDAKNPAPFSVNNPGSKVVLTITDPSLQGKLKPGTNYNIAVSAED